MNMPYPHLLQLFTDNVVSDFDRPSADDAMESTGPSWVFEYVDRDGSDGVVSLEALNFMGMCYPLISCHAAPVGFVVYAYVQLGVDISKDEFIMQMTSVLCDGLQLAVPGSLFVHTGDSSAARALAVMAKTKVRVFAWDGSVCSDSLYLQDAAYCGAGCEGDMFAAFVEKNY